jgi:hypothetical protein
VAQAILPVLFFVTWNPPSRKIHAKVALAMTIEVLFIFLCFSGALSLFLAGATGNLYFSGGRGGGKPAAVITSIQVRLLLSCLGFALLIVGLFFVKHALSQLGP